MSQNINFNVHEVDEDEVGTFLQILVYGEIYDFFTENLLDMVLDESMNSDCIQKTDISVDVCSQKYETVSTEITDCTICLDKFETGDMVSILNDCNHIFHTDCIIEAGKYKAECPLCRKSIPVL